MNDYKNGKPILYIDMDDTICLFTEAFNRAIARNPEQAYPQSSVGFFRNLEPMDNAVAAIGLLEDVYDVWILTRPSVQNPNCYTEKREWIEKYLGFEMCKHLMIVPDKTMVQKGILIDDKPWEGFNGEVIQIGTDQYPDWKSILDRLL